MSGAGATKTKPSMEEEKKEEAVVETPKGMAAWRTRMKERHGEADWDSLGDDGMADMAMADYDALSAQVEQYRKRDAAFDELAEKHPEGMMFLSQLAKGKSVREAIENSMGVSFEEFYNDPDYPAMRQEREEKEREAVGQMLARLDEEAAARGWKSEDVDEALQAIDDFINAVETNSVTMDMLQLLRNGKRYDKDVAKAMHEGEVNGRNAKIEETRRKKKASSDGLPALGGQSKGGESNKTIVRGGRNGVGSGIWDAANMQRRKYE